MIDFLYIHKNWFYKKYFLKLQKRYFTFHIALNCFLQIGGKTIIETGCVRNKNDWGAGNSTVVFGDFCKRYNKKLITVDNNIDNIVTARGLTLEYEKFIEYVHSDSIEFLDQYKKPIDFLYLDSLDCPPQKNANPSHAQSHALNELINSYHKLNNHCVVLIDDNLFANGGKAKLAKEFLYNKGFTLLLDYKQSLWIR